ncbi:hypothetical protein LCGC14_3020420, partial [marine sediment metagenome]
MPKPLTKKQSHEDNGKASTSPLPIQVPGVKNRMVATCKRGLPDRVGRFLLGSPSRLGTFTLTQEKREMRPKLKSLAKNTELILEIKRDIRTLGIIGELEASLLVYIVYTSRLLDDPLAIVMRGVSSSGKSVLLRRVAQLMPLDAVVDAMSMTSASLYNTPVDFFVHKILLTGERMHSKDDQTRDENANLRQLLSEKIISKMKSVQGEGGWHTELIEREGPVAYAESTTSGSIFEEDLNRLLQIYTNESSAQTRQVMQAVAEKYARKKVKSSTQSIIDKHRKFQESLKPCIVRVPFAKTIADNMPAEKVKARRVITQVLAAVEAVALLHQFQRQREDGFLIATVEQDYAVARELLLKPLHAS